MAIYTAADYVIVKPATKYIKNITSITKMAAVQNNTSVEMADLVSIVGEVISVPQKVSNHKRDHAGFSVSDIRPGDTAIFSNHVIFNFESTAPEQEPIFKNRIWYGGNEYFKADITLIYGVVRDGKILMLNGYVMVEELEKPAIIYLPTNVKKRIQASSAVVTQIGKNLPQYPAIDVHIGDTVLYNSAHIMLHQVNNKPFGILRQHQILGVKVPDYAEIISNPN